MHPPWRRRWEVSSKCHDVHPTRCKQNRSLSTEQSRLFLAYFTSTALSLTTFKCLFTISSPITKLQNVSRDVSSGRSHKTSRGRWTDRYNEKASGGRSWRQKPWHVVRWTSFIYQGTLLKFTERTHGANIYNSEFPAAALCSRRCYPHLRFQSQFFPFNTSHLPNLNIHRYHHWASCWPIPISLRGEFRPRQTRQLPRAVDLKGRFLSCHSY